jgi:hypothetical protein
MQLPDYWLQRPPGDIDDATRRAFDELLDAALASGGSPVIDYRLSAPRWQFLCHVADHHGLALHGSGNSEIARFEPRQANDLNEFGRQRAVYAASDGLWAMFFAIVDRDRFSLSVANACVRLADAAGRFSDPYYYFSVSQAALPHRPWRNGTVYLLPPTTFAQQPPMAFGGSQVHIAQLASLEAVVPLARLAVAPEDFPFLQQTRGHDDARLPEYAAALQTGGALPEG